MTPAMQKQMEECWYRDTLIMKEPNDSGRYSIDFKPYSMGFTACHSIMQGRIEKLRGALDYIQATRSGSNAGHLASSARAALAADDEAGKGEL